jgi:hypothetical protein
MRVLTNDDGKTSINDVVPGDCFSDKEGDVFILTEDQLALKVDDGAIIEHSNNAMVTVHARAVIVLDGSDWVPKS